MNKRLLKISEYIEAGKGFVDVGTDHGYLPVYMAQHGYKGNIYAFDINEAPLATAMLHAKQSGLENRIEFRISDGLEACDPDSIDTIVIAGMGGELICRILDYGYWCMNPVYKLILQPMTKQEILRYWLVNNGFEITEEYILHEGHYYQIIAARYRGINMSISDAEAFCGVLRLNRNNILYFNYLLTVINRFEKITQNNNNAFYAEILNELKELKSAYENNG